MRIYFMDGFPQELWKSTTLSDVKESLASNLASIDPLTDDATEVVGVLEGWLHLGVINDYERAFLVSLLKSRRDKLSEKQAGVVWGIFNKLRSWAHSRAGGR